MVLCILDTNGRGKGTFKFYKLDPRRKVRKNAFAQEPMAKKTPYLTPQHPKNPSQSHTYKYGFTCSSLHSQNFSATPEPPSLSGFWPITRSFRNGWFKRPQGMTTRKRKTKKGQSQFCDNTAGREREMGMTYDKRRSATHSRPGKARRRAQCTRHRWGRGVGIAIKGG